MQKKDYLWILTTGILMFSLTGKPALAETKSVPLALLSSTSVSELPRIMTLAAKNQLAEVDSTAYAIETYLGWQEIYLTSEEMAELKVILEEQVSQLKALGWSDTAIAYGYINQLELKKTVSEAMTDLSENFSAAQVFGSDTFVSLWYAQSYGMAKDSAKQLLSLAVSYLQLPLEFSGASAETAHLLTHFSDDLDPANDFWSSFSAVVQKAYPKNSLTQSDSLAKQVHQLRYLISAQQAQWVRTHYGQSGEKDSQALARYLATKNEKDNVAEVIGLADYDYDVTYDLGESSRLHNKIAVQASQYGVNLVIYPNYTMNSNIKITMDFHTEFILDADGNFLNELDPQGTTTNGIVNGASFNYANQNNKRHMQLDVKPVGQHDPVFRKAVSQAAYSYRAPNKLRYAWQETSKLKWENSYFNSEGNYSRNGKSAAKLVKETGRAFKTLIEGYRS